MSLDSIRTIPGFPCYGVTQDGRVFSRRVYGSKTKRLGDWWEMKLKRAKRSRHPYIDLFGDEVGRPYRYFVHQLVMLTYVGQCPQGMQVCHKNDVPGDNRLENLYYGTKKDNSEDAIRNGCSKFGEEWHNATLTNEQVRDIRRLRAAGVGLDELSERFGKSRHYITRIATGEIWRRVI